MDSPTIQRPPYQSVPLKIGLRWNYSPDVQFTEKMDGIRRELAIGKSIIVGELMRDSRFYAFDLPIYDGADIRNLPRRERLEILNSFKLLRPESSDNGGELLQKVLARGGEGICAAHWESTFYDTICRCKRQETHDCTVIEKHPSKLSIHISENGVDRGWCAVLGGSYWEGFQLDKIHVGDVVEIECFGVTAKSKFREPRFVRARPDKA